VSNPVDHLQRPSDVGAGSASSEKRRDLPVGSARSLLLTVLGELVLPHGAPVWTASLLHVLKGLGIEEQTARQAIARAAEAGWIAGEKQGREVRWTVTATGIELIEDITRRVISLSAPPERWDGDCLILLVTVPARQKAVRKRLYSELGWAGFGNPMPGLWASPHVDRATEMKRIIRELDLEDSTITFVGSTISIGLTDHEIVRRAWDLDEVAARYDQLIQSFEALAPDPGDDLLFTHIALVNEWRQFPAMDPQLPEDLLPDWIGRRATEMFLRLRKTWAESARARWREVVEMTSPSSN
jgi:phenylacetic acid degradation operon negative regulatory protein